MLADSMTTTDATNLTALGILAVIVIWSVTKGIPMLRDFLVQQRNEFTDAIVRRDEQSERVSKAGHEAASAIADAMRQNTEATKDLVREVRAQPGGA